MSLVDLRREDGGLLLDLGGLGEIHEGLHVLVDDVRSLNNGIARSDSAVGLDLKDKAVVVGVLTNAARLDKLGATARTGENSEST